VEVYAMTTETTNPALADVAFLVGDWHMTLSGASFLPTKDDVVHGQVEVRPIEAGTLLAMRQGVAPPNPPAATWVIGRDDSRDRYVVLYADGRGVSRVYEMTLAELTWRMWRDDPVFCQRFEATISADHNEISGRWEQCESGGEWEHDFNVAYTREPPGSDVSYAPAGQAGTIKPDSAPGT
jgi:hypothetical protein